MEFGQEMDVSIIIKQIYNMKTFIATSSKPSSSTWAFTSSIFHSKASSQKKIEILGDEHKELYQQWRRDVDSSIWWWGEISIVPLLSTFPPPQCFTMDQYIALKWEMESWMRSFRDIWNAKDQVIHYLVRKNTNNFCFLA